MESADIFYIHYGNLEEYLMNVYYKKNKKYIVENEKSKNFKFVMQNFIYNGIKLQTVSWPNQRNIESVDISRTQNKS